MSKRNLTCSSKNYRIFLTMPINSHPGPVNSLACRQCVTLKKIKFEYEINAVACPRREGYRQNHKQMSKWCVTQFKSKLFSDDLPRLWKFHLFFYIENKAIRHISLWIIVFCFFGQFIFVICFGIFFLILKLNLCIFKLLASDQ